MEQRQVVRYVALSIIAILVIVVFLSTYFTVQPNERAVVTNFGQLSYVADPGLHLKMPFVNNIAHFRTDVQSISPPKGINTYTVDNQEVDVVYTIFYRLPPDMVSFVFVNVRDYEARLNSLAVDRIKVAMGQVNVQSVAEKRGALRDTIKATLAEDAKAFGLVITDFQLTDLQYTDSFRNAVGAAAVQKAGIETREYERQQAQKAAETAAIQAQGQANAVRAKAAGDADARLLQATAEAKAIQIQGEAQAKAIQAQAEALMANPHLVELRQAEKWNGVLPSWVTNATPLPVMQLPAPVIH